MEYQTDLNKIIIFIIIVILISIGIFYYTHHTIRIKNKLEEYKKDPIVKLEVIKDCNDKTDWKNQPLANFQIASSAKSFLIGNQKYDYVSLDMIKQVLLMGARYLELEVLGDSFNSRPKIIVASCIEKGQWQTSLNNESFDKFIETISTYAFSPEIPSYTLPLFIYIDLKLDDNQNALTQVGLILDKYFHDRLMPNNINLAQVPICNLFGKVIIWTSDYSSNSDLDKIISINKPSRYHYTSLSDFNEEQSKYEEEKKPLSPSEAVKHPPPMVRHNYNNLTIIYPNNPDDIFSVNYPFKEAHSYGCQFVALNYQLKDTYLMEYLEYFKTNSIILKSGGLIPPNNFVQEKSLSQMEEKTEKIIRFIPWKNLQNEMENQPIYIRPVNDSRAVIEVKNNRIVIGRKNNSEITRNNLFLIKQNKQNNKNNEIYLESLSKPNYYLIYDGSEFILDKITSNSFVSYRGLSQKYDTQQTISLELQHQNNDNDKQFIGYDSTNDKLIIKSYEDEYQNDLDLTFHIIKQPVESIFHLRSISGRYLTNMEGQLWANAKEKSDKTIINIISGFEAEPQEMKYHDFTHFKFGNNYLRVVKVGDKKVLKVDAKKPSNQTRFTKVNLGSNRMRIFYESSPLIINPDRTCRIGTIHEEENPMGILEIVRDYNVKINEK